ncbi:MAG TPA: DUF3043 domain-containing protein [Nakamurella sp.]
MSFLRRKPANEPAAEPAAEAEPAPESSADGKKGRPTPKRREAEGRNRGPVAPPPKTQREAMKRSKVQRSTMSKDERRAAARTNRERMMAGDERYLLPRDRGKVRAYVRDLVDSRRNVAGILLPIAVLSFVVLLIPFQAVQAYGPLVLLVAIAAAIIDSIIFGRQISRKVRAKFPQGDASGQSTRSSALGFYAFNRACLIRRWRAPRPRVETGERID